MSFGGTKPQNISYLNLQRGGRLSVLPSVPPVLHLRHVKVPRRDFFRETLQRWQYREDCERLSKLYREVRNNMELRRRARRREQLLIAKAMLPVYQLRSSLEPGWSQDGQCALPQAQKVWLDEVYAETRWQDISWQTEIAKAFTRWLMQTRESFEGHDKIVLGNAEFLALQKQVLQAVQETGGMVQEP
jgi:CRISPR-associated protein Csy1